MRNVAAERGLLFPLSPPLCEGEGSCLSLRPGGGGVFLILRIAECSCLEQESMGGQVSVRQEGPFRTEEKAQPPAPLPAACRDGTLLLHTSCSQASWGDLLSSPRLVLLWARGSL